MNRSMPNTALLDHIAEQLGPERVLRDEPLAPWTTFRIGGPADAFYTARTAEELANALRLARAEGVPHFLLGRGANILVGDGGFRGLVIRSAVEGIEHLGAGRVRAGAGVDTFPDLIVNTVSRGLGGLHHFVGIPSSVGGALWQNLHFLSPAPPRERTVFIEEVLEEARILTAGGELRTVDRAYFEFGYDHSILHERDDVVLSATFQLTECDPEALRQVMVENLAWRNERHPDLWLYPCAGSIFQKIEGVGAGRLIDECGLKGHRHGAAMIFHRHANIVVNTGGATAAEVMHLTPQTISGQLRELEEQVREIARQHERLLVFTGPVLNLDDQEYRGRLIPREYWKVVSLINKFTGALSATGYLLSQSEFIDDLEFLYGEYKTYQLPIHTIEAKTGLSFGEFPSHDPLDLIESMRPRIIQGPTDLML